MSLLLFLFIMLILYLYTYIFICLCIIVLYLELTHWPRSDGRVLTAEFWDFLRRVFSIGTFSKLIGPGTKVPSRCATWSTRPTMRTVSSTIWAVAAKRPVGWLRNILVIINPAVQLNSRFQSSRISSLQRRPKAAHHSWTQRLKPLKPNSHCCWNNLV